MFNEALNIFLSILSNVWSWWLQLVNDDAKAFYLALVAFGALTTGIIVRLLPSSIGAFRSRSPAPAGYVKVDSSQTARLRRQNAYLSHELNEINNAMND